MSSVLTPWLTIYPCVHAIRCPFLYIFHSEKNLNLFATNGCNKMCVCVRLLEWLHWWHNFLCYLLEKRYVVFITSWHCSLGGNFLADTIRYLSWPALSRSWHLAASGMGLRVMSHQAGLLTTLHHIHICFPEQGGNMVTTMGWGFSDFRQLFCFPLLINKACMYHNHIPLMYIFDSPANECWVSYSFKKMHFKTSSAKWHRFCVGLNFKTYLIDFTASCLLHWNRNVIILAKCLSVVALEIIKVTKWQLLVQPMSKIMSEWLLRHLSVHVWHWNRAP